MAEAQAKVASPPAPIRDIPFARGTMRMGLSPLAASRWIETGDDLVAQMAEKRRLLSERREQVLAALVGSDAAAREALEILVANLRAFHADAYRSAGPSGLRNPSGETVDLVGASHPLEIAARLVQEDFCVLEESEGQYRLTAGCVCFPSNWSLVAKIGRPVGEIHAPVPDFDEALAAPVERFFARLMPGHLVERLNWLIHDSPDLFQLGRAAEPAGITAANAGDRLWLRTERQVLQRLPRTGAVLFTIRTRVRPLHQAIPSPAKAAELAAALRAMPPGLQSYRHMAPLADALLAWLDQEAAHVLPA